MTEDLAQLLRQTTGFDWDIGNSRKNWQKHRVTTREAEQVFFNRPLRIAPDSKHSHTEQRYAALGRTNSNRRLFVVFTIRGKKIRVISARDHNKKDQEVYEQETTQKAA